MLEGINLHMCAPVMYCKNNLYCLYIIICDLSKRIIDKVVTMKKSFVIYIYLFLLCKGAKKTLEVLISQFGIKI